jgi:hypothetical protein
LPGETLACKGLKAGGYGRRPLLEGVGAAALGRSACSG